MDFSRSDRGAPSLLIAGALLAAGVAVLSAQQTAFRGSTITIPVYATVLGADGRLVTGLGKDDFEVLDNGKAQAITVFSNDLQPITVVLLLDRSGSVVRDFDLVREAAARFVDDLLPADKARIGSFADRVQVDPQMFTSDKEELRQILATQLQEPGPTPLWNAVAVGMTALLHVDGRRVVLVFTDGSDEPGIDRPTNVSLREVIDRARDEDVMVYTIGLTGSGRGARPWSGGRTGGFGAAPSPGRFSGGPAPDAGLATLAAQSGGGHFVLTSARDLTATFAQVAEELHRQYALGFTAAAMDGRVHTLEVRVKQPGTTVRARKSYAAPRKR